VWVYSYTVVEDGSGSIGSIGIDTDADGDDRSPRINGVDWTPGAAQTVDVPTSGNDRCGWRDYAYT
jgi:hypothetical protein